MDFQATASVIPPCGAPWGGFCCPGGVASPLRPRGRARCRALALAPSASFLAPSLSFVCSACLRCACVLSVRSARSSLPPSLRAPPAPAGAYRTPRGSVKPNGARWRYPPPRGLRLACARAPARALTAHTTPAQRAHNARRARFAYKKGRILQKCLEVTNVFRIFAPDLRLQRGR